MFGVKQKAARAARKAAFGAVATVMVGVGIAFLTAAAFIVLATAYDAVVAAGVLGATYLGLGMIFMGCAVAQKEEELDRPAPANETRVPPQAGQMPPVAEAFAFGLSQGMKASAARDEAR